VPFFFLFDEREWKKNPAKRPDQTKRKNTIDSLVPAVGDDGDRPAEKGVYKPADQKRRGNIGLDKERASRENSRWGKGMTGTARKEMLNLLSSGKKKPRPGGGMSLRIRGEDLRSEEKRQADTSHRY